MEQQVLTSLPRGIAVLFSGFALLGAALLWYHNRAWSLALAASLAGTVGVVLVWPTLADDSIRDLVLTLPLLAAISLKPAWRRSSKQSATLVEPKQLADRVFGGALRQRAQEDEITSLEAMLRTSPDSDAVLAAASERARELLTADCAAVLLAGPQGVGYHARNGWADITAEESTVFVTSGRDAYQQVSESSSDHPIDLPLSGPPGARVVLSAPITGEGLPTAALVVWRCASRRFTLEDQRILDRLASSTTSAWRRVRSRQRIARVDTRWPALLEAVSVPIVLLGRDDVVAFANRRAELLIGGSDELVGRAFRDIVPGATPLLECLESATSGWVSIPPNGRPERRVALDIQLVTSPEGSWRLVRIRDVDPSAERASGETLSLDGLARALLTVAREPAAAPARDAVNLRELVVTTVRERLSRSANREATLEIDVPDDPALVCADRRRLQLMVDHVLQNAEEAVRSCPVRRIAVSLAKDREDWVLAVDDTGPGIPYPLRTKVFEPFFTTKPDGDGSGLGLAAAHGVVKQHGGRLSVKDSGLGGARFEIRLPAA